MNVDRAAAVPARIDGGKVHLAIAVGDLVTPQKLLARCRDGARAAAGVVCGFIRVDACRAAVPHIEVGSGQRGATRIGIYHRDRQRQGDSRLDEAGARICANVGPEQFLVHPVGPFGDVGRRQRAGRGGRFDGLVPCRNKVSGGSCPGKAGDSFPAA